LYTSAKVRLREGERDWREGRLGDISGRERKTESGGLR